MEKTSKSTVFWSTMAVLVASIWVPWGSAYGQVIANGHCLEGCPQGALIDNSLIIRPTYTLSFNSSTKSADWVAYSLSAKGIGVASSLSREVRLDDFVADTLTPADFLEDSSFVFAQYVPLIDFAGTPFWQDANYATNYVPRTKSLHQGAWYGLNWSVRNAVSRLGEVHILTGPVYYSTPRVKRLEVGKTHRTPDAFFKLISAKNGGMSAFLLDQSTPIHVHHCDLESDLETIETLTGLDFFPEAESQDFNSIASYLGCF